MANPNFPHADKNVPYKPTRNEKRREKRSNLVGAIGLAMTTVSLIIVDAVHTFVPKARKVTKILGAGLCALSAVFQNKLFSKMFKDVKSWF